MHWRDFGKALFLFYWRISLVHSDEFHEGGFFLIIVLTSSPYSHVSPSFLPSLSGFCWSCFSTCLPSPLRSHAYISKIPCVATHQHAHRDHSIAHVFVDQWMKSAFIVCSAHHCKHCPNIAAARRIECLCYGLNFKCPHRLMYWELVCQQMSFWQVMIYRALT